jgi:hypothetical protein
VVKGDDEMKSYNLTLSLPLLLIGSASAATLTFDELPHQSVNGLSFGGVTFGFVVEGAPSVDAYYNAGPGLNLTFVQGPSLEGSSFGVLTLHFLVPASMLRFGLARSTFDPLTPGFTVDAFTRSALIRSFSVNTAPLISFSEGLFHYSDPSRLISRAVIRFDDPSAADRFALDNLTFNEVPEPNSVLLLTSGLTAALTYRVRRIRRANGGRRCP